MEKLVPKCSPRTLFVFAAAIWMMAGSMVTRFGLEALISVHRYILISIVVAVVVFFVFFKFIFKKMAFKHQKRIKSMEGTKVCSFSFFDKKGYMIMACMMSMGIFIRSCEAIDPICWAAFYIGLGLALFSAGVLFARGWFKWKTEN